MSNFSRYGVCKKKETHLAWFLKNKFSNLLASRVEELTHYLTHVYHDSVGSDGTNMAKSWFGSWLESRKWSRKFLA